MNVAFAIEKVYTACPVEIVIISTLISFGIICVAHRLHPSTYDEAENQKEGVFCSIAFPKKEDLQRPKKLAITDEEIFKKIRKSK